MGMTLRAEKIVSDLYRTYAADPSLVPDVVRQRFDEDGEARAIADHVACMTDRYAEAEHAKVVGKRVPA